MSSINKIFKDKSTVRLIQNKLPYLFQIAELDTMRGGKIGMEVGSIRERILISLLIYKFGINNVQSEFPTTMKEVDVALYDEEYSIKTITQKKLSGGVKLIWTVDAIKAKEFMLNYTPNCGMILVHISWGNIGGIYYFSKSLQEKILNKIGREQYINMPKEGTNPRGVSMSNIAIQKLALDQERLFIPINWIKNKIDYNPITKWVDLWKESNE